MGSRQYMVDVTEKSLMKSLRIHIQKIETLSETEGILALFDEWMSLKLNTVNANSLGIDCDHIKVEIQEDALLNSNVIEQLVLNVDEETWKKWREKRSNQTLTTTNQNDMPPDSHQRLSIPDYQTTIDDVIDRFTTSSTASADGEVLLNVQPVEEHLEMQSDDKKRPLDKSDCFDKDDEESVHVSKKRRNESVNQRENQFISNQSENDSLMRSIIKRVRAGKSDIATDDADDFVCQTCSKSFAFRTDLEEHESSCRDCFTCEDCGKLYKTAKSLSFHQRIHRGEGFQCKECDKVFPRREYLKDHMRIHTGEVPYKCSECSAMFRSRSHRTKHMRTKHSNEKPYVCKVCNKAFIALYMLKSHFVSHTQVKKYRCEICNQTFGLVENIRRHMKIVHAKAREHKCPNCHRSFQFNYLLNKHVNDCHGIKTEESVAAIGDDESMDVPLRVRCPRIIARPDKSRSERRLEPKPLQLVVNDPDMILESVDNVNKNQALYLIQMPDGQLQVSATEDTDDSQKFLIA
ncbi:uncharacterized protein LOC141905957 isoform X2 [Tubulanus polymorphus]|uniref:uncharacterized protein LOC141905957 isoform X2 n=1 Tax=Tubulanus polymorphus TaxID=672921 RepID=UPI003DA2CD31